VHIIAAVVGYAWDKAKERANYEKHGVHFADAVGALEDEYALTEPDASAQEERFRTLGTDFLGRLMIVVYTYRGEDIRLISARKAKPRHRALYERRRR
jgi:uncharacterized DUF497 family protein